LTQASGVPTWAAAPQTGITIADDTTTNATRYITFTDATTGTETGLDVSSTKLQYNPSTGVVTATGFSGALNGTVGATTPTTATFTDVTLNGQGDLRFADSDSSNWVAFQAPATVASNVTWTLPDADGTSGQVLSTNGSGTLSWASGGGGSGDVVGPASATDSAIALFDGTTGKLLKNGVIYTNANTASTVVQRDASGNFSAGTITATLSGNASTATSAATWTTARTLSIGGTGKSVNGSADVTWTTAEIGINTTNVLNATAGAALGAVGTYAFLGRAATGTTTAGDTIAGADLRFGGIRANATWQNTITSINGANSTNTPSGTWMFMAQQTVSTQAGAAVWLRIS
jgi:hypothetical protein